MLLLVGVLVLVLMLTVFKGEDKNDGEGKAASEPAAVAEAYLKALEEDYDTYLNAALEMID